MTLPEVTKCPVALSTKLSGSPAAEVKFWPDSSGEYTVEPLMSCEWVQYQLVSECDEQVRTWFWKRACRAVVLLCRLERELVAA